MAGADSVNYLSEDDQSSRGGGSAGDMVDISSHGGADGSSTSGHPSGASTAGSDSQNEHLGLGKRLTRNVNSSKMAVLAILFLVTIGVCLAVYFITSNGEEAEFQTTFEGQADKVLTSFQGILEQKIAAIASLGVTFTAFAQANNDTWPFVTMNDFQQRAASAKGLSDAYFLELLPIVTDDDREKWEEYSVENKGWLSEGREYQQRFDIEPTTRNLQLAEGDVVTGDVVNTFTGGESSISETIFTFDENWATISSPRPGPYYPIWQSSPILPEPRDLVNYDLKYYADYGPYIKLAAQTGQIAIGGLDVAEPGDITHPELSTSFFAYLFSFAAGQRANYTGDPMSSVYIPVVDSFDDDRKTVGILVAVINWATYFEDTLPSNAKPVVVVLENSCDGQYSYEVSGEGVKYLGPGNQADPKFDEMGVGTSLDTSFVAEATTIALTLNQDLCEYFISVFPSSEMDDEYNTAFPIIITVVIGTIFVFTAAFFLLYDRMVERRQKIVLDTAQRSTAIVSSIFPKQVVGRLMSSPVQGNATKLRSLMTPGSKSEVNALTTKGDDSDGELADITSAPIADYFPEATVIFADVAGFTAWSSVRQPTEVFVLLETLYAAFDKLAARLRVFKVETVGDCFVAVSGVPDPRKDHAVVICKFARLCIEEHIRLTKKLEVTLGPDTGDLQLRVGCHSGPITAGVLRGSKSRFQLFGDTVNTTARMETSSQGNAIHISEATAKLLIDAGKEHWLLKREDRVQLKGKGSPQTYWVRTKSMPERSDGIVAGTETFSEASSNDDQSTLPMGVHTKKTLDAKTERLIDWNTEVLLRLIRQIVARRRSKLDIKNNESDSKAVTEWGKYLDSMSSNPIDEVVEIIPLPEFVGDHEEDPDSIQLDLAVIDQVKDYVRTVASFYNDNGFHNFEHASHVTMSVAKLLTRIVAPSDMDYTDSHQAKSKLHDHTYGITSDPLTQLACVWAALIHDCDHYGVPNNVLIQEDDPLCEAYKNKSVAEQHSIDLSWDLFMEDRFEDLRATICGDIEDLNRLRQLIVNCVMATDIMDADLKKLRNHRWDTAFSSEQKNESEKDQINRKATIVIEHLIQASDVAHTMQHWNVYLKWNGRLFQEMYKAYKDGRTQKDPIEFWYKGEIGFFDFYIIPLAKKLKNCGVFGVSSDEYLQYAISNRDEWERKGKSVVEKLIASVQQEIAADTAAADMKL
mmetsp:Transcript_21372/g.50809  ORF Transcript_21372/g.50809 Transcript_21372/m.50809 type:complete len:1202 (-) Transcript_21372:132-3737(-)